MRRVVADTVDVAKPVRDLAFQQAQIERKFRHLAEPAVGAATASEIIDICRNLESQPNVFRLMQLCCP